MLSNVYGFREKRRTEGHTVLSVVCESAVKRLPWNPSAMFWKSTRQARSCNHCYCGTAIGVTYSECVFVALGTAHMPYCHQWPAPLYNIFPHYLINGTIFGRKSLNTKCVFWFSVQLLSETFPIVRRTERDMIKNVHTVIPRLTKIIRSGITFVSRNVKLSGVSLLAVSNVNNPVGLVGLPYVMWSAHFFVTHIQTEKDKLLELPDPSCLLLYVSARIH